MGRVIPIIKEELKELKERLRKEKNLGCKTKLHILVLLKSREPKTRKPSGFGYMRF